jgi:hypothetical protein
MPELPMMRIPMQRRTPTFRSPFCPHGLRLACTLATLLVAAACSPAPKADPGKVKISDEMQLEADKEFVREPVQDQIAQAVIRQHTIFDYQFEASSAKLTSLGTRDVRILAAAMRDGGGSISVRRGSADAALYASRRETVRKALLAEGIGADRIRLDDAAPGGSGTTTTDALQIRERIQRSPMKPPPKDILSPTGGTATGGR